MEYVFQIVKTHRERKACAYEKRLVEMKGVTHNIASLCGSQFASPRYLIDVEVNTPLCPACLQKLQEG